MEKLVIDISLIPKDSIINTLTTEQIKGYLMSFNIPFIVINTDGPTL